MPKNGFYFDDTSFDKGTGEFNPKNFNPINTISDKNLRVLADYGKHLYKNIDYAMKETCHEMMDRAAEAFIGCLKLINEAVGDYCFA